MAAGRVAVPLEPEDDDVVLTGGVRVARMCAGLEPAMFLMHLDGAAAILRTSLLDAGISHEAAHLTVEAFEVGAREEWLRIGGTTRAMTWGRA